MRILVPWLNHLFEAKGFPTPSKVRVLSREEPKFKKKPLQKFLTIMAGGMLFRFRISLLCFYYNDLETQVGFIKISYIQHNLLNGKEIKLGI